MRRTIPDLGAISGLAVGRRPPIYNRVRELRERHGAVTQAELGDAIGVTRQTVAAIERGRYSPSLESAFRIARFFRLGVEDVFAWDESGSTPAR